MRLNLNNGKRLSATVCCLAMLCFSCGYLYAEELTWQDCIREAAQNHPDLISAQEQVKESQASKRITASALLPQVSSELSRATAKSTSGAETKTYSYGVTGSQLLFDGTKTINDVRAASENIKAAQYGYKFTSSEVRLRLRTAFISLLKTQELLQITEDIYNIRRSNLELITLRYESGLEHKGALLSAEANLAQARFESLKAKRALEVAQRQLIKEMGRGKFSPLQVKGDFTIKAPLEEKPDFEVLVNNNPSLHKLIAQKNSAQFGLRSSYANFFPALSGRANVGRSGARWPAQDSQWNLGLTLSFPIFEGGLRLAQVSAAQSLLNQLKADERSARDGLIVALEEVWAALQDATETVGVQNKFLDAAGERAKIAEAQYSLGLIQFDDWTIIEDNLVSAKKSYLDAQANTLLAEANWIQAKGETLEYAD